MLNLMQLLGLQLSEFYHLHVFVFMFSIFTIFVTKWIFRSPKVLHKNLPPSPPKLPVIGNLHQLGVHHHHSLWSLAQRYGPLMLLHLGSRPALIVSSADAAREVMKTHDIIFSNRPKASITDRLLYHGKDVATAPYGEYWRQMKSVCVLQLLSKRRVQSFQSVREEEISLLLEKIGESSSMSLSVNLSQMFLSLTNDIICRVAFGRKYNEEGRKFEVLLREFTELLGVGSVSVGDFIPWLWWVDKIIGNDAKVDKVAKEFDKFLEEVVEDHVNRLERENEKGSDKSEEKKDFVDVLLEIQKENAIGMIIDRDSLKALILDMFSGGTDTTFTALEWTMTEILKHSEIMMKAQNEIRNYSSDRPFVTLEDLDKMLYLKAIIKETLRLHPPVPLLVPRLLTEDVKLQGYDISAGTVVITNAWAIGRDLAYWDQPEEFQPERFLGTSIDFKGNDFQLIPFGAGRRSCPGTLFATVTIELVLANLLLKFDWSLPNKMRGKDLDMSESIGINVHRKHPLIAVATPVSASY